MRAFTEVVIYLCLSAGVAQSIKLTELQLGGAGPSAGGIVESPVDSISPAKIDTTIGGGGGIVESPVDSNNPAKSGTTIGGWGSTVNTPKVTLDTHADVHGTPVDTAGPTPDTPKKESTPLKPTVKVASQELVKTVAGAATALGLTAFLNKIAPQPPSHSRRAALEYIVRQIDRELVARANERELRARLIIRKDLSR